MRRAWIKLKHSMKLSIIDASAVKWLLLIPFLVMGYIMVDIVSATEYETEARIWRFGYLGQQWLLLSFLFWTLIPLHRWYSKEEAESLNTAANRHCSIGGIIWMIILEGVVFIPVLLYGLHVGLNFFWEIIRILIFQMILSSIVYLLTVLFGSAFLSLIITAVYCMFCSVYGNDSHLFRYCLFRPGNSVGEGMISNSLTIFKMWPILIGAILISFIAYQTERKRSIIKCSDISRIS